MLLNKKIYMTVKSLKQMATTTITFTDVQKPPVKCNNQVICTEVRKF